MTMVVTHVPSNILLILVPLMPTEALAIVTIIARFSISQMDVPTRNAFVTGIVNEDERSAANGLTGVARSLGASIGPSLAGSLLMYNSSHNYIFYISGGLKLLYDFVLLLSFASMEPTGKGGKSQVEIDRTKKIASTSSGINSEGEQIRLLP